MESLAPPTTPNFNPTVAQEAFRRIYNDAGIDQSAAIANILAAMEAPTEFHKAGQIGMMQISGLVCQYPMIFAIQMVACAILGLTNLLSFNLLTAVVLLTLAGITALGIKQNATAYWNALSTSFWQIKDWIFASVQNASSTTPSNTTTTAALGNVRASSGSSANRSPSTASPVASSNLPKAFETDEDGEEDFAKSAI